MGVLKRALQRIVVGVGGGLVLVVGIIAIPYPGPGWLIVFAGLAILATEFAWARRALDTLHKLYDSWQVWLKSRPKWQRLFVGLLTVIVVALTIYLLNGYGYLNVWLGLGWNWLQSPLPFFGS